MITVKLTLEQAQDLLKSFYSQDKTLAEAFPGHEVSVQITLEMNHILFAYNRDLVMKNKIFMIKFCRDFMTETNGLPRGNNGTAIYPSLFASKEAVEKLTNRNCSES